MKITATPQGPASFRPVSFYITCESQVELDAWRALFNHTPFANYLGMPSSMKEIALMDKLGADKQQADQIWNKFLKGVTFIAD